MFQKFFVAFLFLLSIHLHSENIAGIVRDAQTGEALIGASVFLKNNKSIGTTTGLDGSFVLKNIPSGKVLLVCSYISYKTIEQTIQIPTAESQKIILQLVSYENELSDVIVTASNKTSDVGVRAIERLSSNILNVVGARSIEISPDLTVANVLGRISGVTMERNSSGEAEYAILRGMDKRYNITLVNGAKISSPNNKQRFVPLNIFPSELLDRLEVSKTRGAEMEGDATGGAVNMVMKDAPHKLSVTANASTGYNAILFTQGFMTYDNKKSTAVAPYEKYGKEYVASVADFSPMQAVKSIQPLPNIIAGFSIGSRILDKKLGYIVAANYQNTNKGTNTTYFGDEMTQQDSTLKLTEIRKRKYSENQLQYGLHAKFDYVFSKNNRVELYNFLVSNNNSQVRLSDDTNYKLHYDPANGNFDKSYQTRIRNTKQFIFASMLQGEHKLFSNLDLKWMAIYSKAGLNNPDQMYINTDNLISANVDSRTIDNDGSDRRWEHNSDQDISGMLNLNYVLPVWNGKLKFEVGGLYRNKSRDNFYVNYVFQPIDMNQQFESIDEIDWSLKTTRGSVGPLTFKASENIASGYFQSKFEKSKFEAIAGVRVEYTNQNYLMAYPKAGISPDGGQTYTDILPNLQLKYSNTNKMNWRAGYFRSLNRPGYFDIIPYQIQEEEYTEYGNPDLKRSLIDNFDLRWEFFPKPMDQFMVGAFYKRIEDPIEFAYYAFNARQGGLGLVNLGDAQNIGLEVDWIKYIRVFGFKANYTYTNSTITTPKTYYAKTETGDTKTFTKDQTRPLVGQASHVANLSLLIKDVKNGWDAQLSASYTGEKIAIVSRFLNSDYWDKATINFDASIEKKFNSGWSVFTKANNLLNTPNIRFVKTRNAFNDNFELQSATSGNTIKRKEYFYQSVVVGIRFKM